jgi:hypothetical protein
MKKYFRYIWAIIKHKWFVFLECAKYGLVWRGLVHDWHKFLPSEFFAYMEKFYGDYGSDIQKPQVNECFLIAMNHHMARAKHHWNYWVYLGYDKELVPIRMPYKYLLEMVCDWKGASRAYSGKNDCKEWYEGVKDRIVLHSDTREIVEGIIYQ